MDSRKKSPVPKQSSPSQLTTVYLLIYNSILTIGSVHSGDGTGRGGYRLLFIDGRWFCLKRWHASYPTNQFVIWVNAMDCGMPLNFHLKSVRQLRFLKYASAQDQDWLMIIFLSLLLRSFMLCLVWCDQIPWLFSFKSFLAFFSFGVSQTTFHTWGIDPPSLDTVFIPCSGPIDSGHLLGSDRLERHRDHPVRVLRIKLVSSCPAMVDMVQVSSIDPAEFSLLSTSSDIHFLSFFTRWAWR